MLFQALGDCQSGAMAHLDESERASIVASIEKRIAELDSKIERMGAV